MSEPGPALATAVTIAVSGATGYVGGQVARLLAVAGERQRLVVRDVSRAPKIGSEVATIVDYRDPMLRAALTGADSVFMVSGKESADRLDQHRAFVDAAVSAGVKHVVYTSFYGAAPDSVFTHGRLHWATEEHIRASGMHFTFLRDNLYSDFAQYLAGEDGVIRGPAGNGAASMVARDDVAEVAVAVLRDPASHLDRAYDMTGPRQVTLTEVAELLTAHLGRPVRYHGETIEEAYASRANYNAPAWEVDAWVSTYTAIAAGEMSGISGDVERITGRPATSIEQVLAKSGR